MHISDKLRKVVLRNWFVGDVVLRKVLDEFKRQYSSDGQAPGERATFLTKKERERLEKEIRVAISGNDNPHIFLEVLGKIEPRPKSFHKHPVFVTNWPKGE